MTADLPPHTRTPVTLPDGTPVIGWSGPTPPAAPRCRCSHAKGTHYRDRKGRDICGSAACGCAVYRPKSDAIPARFDERYDPSPEPIDRSIQ